MQRATALLVYRTLDAQFDDENADTLPCRIVDTVWKQMDTSITNFQGDDIATLEYDSLLLVPDGDN